MRWLWILLLLLIAAAVAYVATRPKPLVVDALVTKREDVQLSVMASGRVLAPARVDIGATITGRVQRVAVREGARVSAGELLILLEQMELNAAVAQARAARDRARARVQSVTTLALPTARESQTQAEANVALAEREHQHQRSQDLLARNFISQARTDEAARQLQVVRSQLAAARSQVGAQGAQGAEAQQVRQQLLESEAALDVAQAKLAQTEIRAPAAGVVLERLTEPGDIAQPAKRMLTLALDGPSRLIVQVDEKNLPLLQKGRTATAVVDAFPAERFTAEIAYISPGIDATRGTVELRLDIPKPPSFLKSDMTVAIDLTGPVLKQALIIPADTIRQLQSDAPYVLPERAGIATRAPLRTGLQMQGRVQILDGLAPGDRVILSRDVETGARVRERR